VSTRRNVPCSYVYYATPLSTAVSLVLLLAPSAYYRLRFREGDRASPIWAVCNAASACPARASAARTLASSTARPAIRSRWASWTTSWARSATLREVV
jgi:hypothetical protein